MLQGFNSEHNSATIANKLCGIITLWDVYVCVYAKEISPQVTL